MLKRARRNQADERYYDVEGDLIQRRFRRKLKRAGFRHSAPLFWLFSLLRCLRFARIQQYAWSRARVATNLESFERREGKGVATPRTPRNSPASYTERASFCAWIHRTREMKRRMRTVRASSNFCDWLLFDY